MIRFIALSQGIYFFITGLWPILDINSFMVVTGPKTDIWLVKMVGALTVSISFLLLYAGISKRMTPESFILILTSFISYLFIDVIYTLNKTIGIIYLADAVIEAGFILLWIFGLKNHAFNINTLI